MVLRLLAFMILVHAEAISQEQLLTLAANGTTNYRIIIPAQATATEVKAAGILQDYFFRVTGAPIAIDRETTVSTHAGYFFIGNTIAWRREIKQSSFLPDVFRTIVTRNNIFINGSSKGVLYGVYAFLEETLGCRKWDAGPAFVPRKAVLQISSSIDHSERPAFSYREVYLPASFDDEYLDWHRLQRFESLWGVWGHSFFKLLPPAVYFKSHPEFFSLVDGKRQPLQLCLSNKTVLNIVTGSLRKAMAENPQAMYWSVSPNDDIGNCECDNCRKLDDADGGPQGSLIHFVNAVAKVFPGKKITTLAYGYSAHAPLHTWPAENVIIMLSSIDAFRTVPLTREPSAASFRTDLARWKEKSATVFVWDYNTQFTNYLTPFPVTSTFKPNILFFRQFGVSGVFAQGSGDTYSDMHELKAYVLARLLWDPGADADIIIRDFLAGYYGKAAPFIRGYLDLLQTQISRTGARLDIYGNPVNNHDDYLSPVNMDSYSSWMDKAEAAVENDVVQLQRVRALRLTQEYVYLQQARFFGKDKHGLFEKDKEGSFNIKSSLPARVANFAKLGQDAGVKFLSEAGSTLQQYHDEWQTIFRTPAATNLASNATVTLAYPFVADYPAKRERTLIDETPGYTDFSYNWLCFYDTPMDVTLDLKKQTTVKKVFLHFLEDARHWIFRPSSVSIQVSSDGINYRALNIGVSKPLAEDFTINYIPFNFAVDATLRFIKIRAENWPQLPAWRMHRAKKPMIACDEVWVN